MGFFCLFDAPVLPRRAAVFGKAGLSALLMGGFIAALYPAPSRAETWADLVAAAKKEGAVDVIGAPGHAYGEALKAFNRKYPEITLNFVGMAGRNALPRLLRERQAKIFTTDVYINGSSTILSEFKPRDMLEPLRPALLDPDVTDDAKWHGGFEAGWLDHDKTYLYAFESLVESPAYVNWDYVSKDELKSVQDLLKPAFAGKIVMDDPKEGGAGSNASVGFLVNFGEDFLKSLFRQNIIYTGNRRQAAEWMVRGRYPINIGGAIDDIAVFQEQGLGKNISPLPPSVLPTQLIKSGFGSVVLLKDAPHPNAAKVYVNWLLSKDGQAAWAGVPRNSRRNDVPAGIPSLAMEDGVKYINIQHEDLLGDKDRANDIAKETIAATINQKP
jgi:iron(III) transport system substrate-binding protein